MPRKAESSDTGSLFYEEPIQDVVQPAAKKSEKKDEKDDRGDWKCGCECPCYCRIPNQEHQRGRRICGMCERGIHSAGMARKRTVDDIPTAGGYGVPGSRGVR